jgi:hypothetical protein
MTDIDEGAGRLSDQPAELLRLVLLVYGEKRVSTLRTDGEKGGEKKRERKGRRKGNARNDIPTSPTSASRSLYVLDQSTPAAQAVSRALLSNAVQTASRLPPTATKSGGEGVPSGIEIEGTPKTVG